MTHLLLALAAMFALGAVAGGFIAWVIPARAKPSSPQDEYDAEDVAGHEAQEIDIDVYVTPGHPVKAGAGYDCNCGECLYWRGTTYSDPYRIGGGA